MNKFKTTSKIIPFLSEIKDNNLKNIKVIFFDFDGVFTDNKVILSEDNKESVICSRLDGIGLSVLKKIGIKMFVISSEKNEVVKLRCKKLNLDCFHGVENKAKVIKNILDECKLKKENSCFIGNDVNDIPAFKSVQLRIGVFDRHPEIDNYIDFITLNKGGNGAVREFCDIFNNIRTDILQG